MIPNPDINDYKGKTRQNKNPEIDENYKMITSLISQYQKAWNEENHEVESHLGIGRPFKKTKLTIDFRGKFAAV